MDYDIKKLAGLLLFVGAAQFVLAVIVAEALDTEYMFLQPMNWLGSGSAGIIFNSSLFLLGFFVIISAYFIQQVFKSTQPNFDNRLFWFLLTMTGIGAVGVGIFSESYGDVHVFFVRMLWIFSITAAFMSYRFQKKPFAYLSIVLGAVILVGTVLFLSSVYVSTSINYLGIGRGGMQRMIQYPILLWLLGFGAYLAGDSSRENRDVSKE